MGHIRLGRLPKRWRWPQVFEQVDSLSPDPASVAGGIAKVAARDLGSLHEHPDVIGYRVWLLSYLGDAASHSDFARRLSEMGIPDASLDHPISFVTAISRVRPHDRFPREHSVFDAMATLSLRECLNDHLSMRTESLFDSRAQSLQRYCAELARPKVFAAVTRSFLSTFSRRLILYVANREISNSISTNGPLRDSRDVLEFESRIDAYCFDSSRIVEDFAESWFAKHRYRDEVGISLSSATGFAALALRKLQMEFEGLDGPP